MDRLDYRIAAAVFAPLLLVQGLWVRRHALRLPEPPGERSGTAGAGAPLRLLIAGDSAAAGVGAATQQSALSGALATALSPHYCVSWRVEARTGLRTGQVLARLERLAAEPYDVALLSLGVNDVTGGTRAADFEASQRQLVRLLRQRFGVRLVLLTSLPPMHAFPALPQPLRWVLGARARSFTRLLAGVVATEPVCELLTPELPLEPRFMADDGFHPGPLAYAEWGRAAAAVIRRWPEFNAPGPGSNSG